MARMLPAVLPVDVASPAEPIVFEALRDDPQTADWTVLHSLDIARHTSRPFGEADFVVIVPGWGLVVIEVKGVRSIARAPDGSWLLGAKRESDPVGPFRQARDAMFSIREELRRRAPRLHPLTTSLVVLPFIPLGMESMEWEPWEVADRPLIDRYGYVGVIRRAMKGQVERLGRGPGAATMTDESVDEVVHILRPSFEINISPRQRLADLEARTLAYTEEQFAALDAMSSNTRVAFDGAAGTGKTVLAVEAVRRSASTGQRTLLVCFNRLLADALRTEVAALTGVEAMTVHAHMLRTSGLRPPEEDDPEFWDRVLPEAATAAALEQGPTVDVLVIDEAQDILPEESLRTYLDAILVGELSGGRWSAFGDFANQAIFAGASVLPDSLSAVPRYSLVRNCRNARSIALAAASVAGLGHAYRSVLREDDGPSVHVAEYRDEDGLVTRVLEAVAALTHSGHLASEITILVPRADSAVVRVLAPQQLVDVRHRPATTSVHTVQAFKGLEAPAIVLAGIEDIGTAYWRSVLYVGITRARHEIHIVIDSAIRAEFDRIVAEEQG